MLKDGIAETGREEALRVLDLAEVVASALPVQLCVVTPAAEPAKAETSA
jgi:hypothetical protein